MSELTLESLREIEQAKNQMIDKAKKKAESTLKAKLKKTNLVAMEEEAVKNLQSVHELYKLVENLGISSSGQQKYAVVAKRKPKTTPSQMKDYKKAIVALLRKTKRSMSSQEIKNKAQIPEQINMSLLLGRMRDRDRLIDVEGWARGAKWRLNKLYAVLPSKEY